MTIKLDHGTGNLIVPIGLASLVLTGIIWGGGSLLFIRLALLIVSIILVILIFIHAKIVFEPTNLYINFGLHSKLIKYGNIEKVEVKKHIKLWRNGKKHPWELRMKDKDKAVFVAELRKRNPSIVIK